MIDTEREKLLAERQTGIGGSDAAAIVGKDRWRTPLDVWSEKVHGPPPERDQDNVDLLRGRVLEPVAADLYAQRTGRRLRKIGLRRLEKPWDFVLVHADRMILSERTGENGGRPTGMLEIKCPRLKTYLHVRDHGASDAMILQVQHGLAVTGWDFGSFAVFNAEAPLLTFDMQRDQRLIDSLLEAEHEFWHQHVIPGIPPEVDAPEVKLPELPQTEGRLTTVPQDRLDEFYRAMARYVEARELYDSAEEAMKGWQEKLYALAEALEAPAIEYPEVGRVYNYATERRGSFDEAKIRAKGLDPDELRKPPTQMRYRRIYPAIRGSE